MRRSRLGIYLGATFALTWGCWWSAVLLTRRGILAADTAAALALVVLGGVAPTLAGYASVAATGGRRALAEYNGRVLRWRVAPSWYAIALLLPAGLGLAARWLATLGGAGAPATSALKPWGVLLPTFLLMLFGGGLEEPGWRGVLLPELRRKRSPLVASAILGPIWIVWHLPLFYLPGISQYGASIPVMDSWA